MVISLNLSDFKSAGVYIREYSMSSNITLNTSTLRLIVGFSKKGPINTPVFLQDASDAKNIFGPIDKTLERRGSYFHRALYKALEVGPVFALNLLALNNDTSKSNADMVPYMSFSIATDEQNGTTKEELLQSFYNTSGFWTPSEDKFLALVNKPNSPNKGKLLNFVNIGNMPLTFLVTKTNPTSIPKFNITAREWYNSGDSNSEDVPSYVEEYDYISDYFIDVTILQGDWSNYSLLSIDPTYNKYFTTSGLIKSKLNEFLALSEVKSFGTFTGCIIPNLKDSTGNIYSIDSKINSNFGIIGAYCAIDESALERYDVQAANADETDNICAVDVVGHNIANTHDICGNEKPTPNSVNFLSYSFGIKDQYTYDKKESFTPILETDLSTMSATGNFRVISNPLRNNNGLYYNILQFRLGADVGPDALEYRSYYNIFNNVIANKTLVQLHATYQDDNSKYALVQRIYETTSDTDGAKILNLVVTSALKRDETMSEVFEAIKDMNSVTHETITINDWTINSTNFDFTTATWNVADENTFDTKITTIPLKEATATELRTQLNAYATAKEFDTQYEDGSIVEGYLVNEEAGTYIKASVGFGVVLTPGNTEDEDDTNDEDVTTVSGALIVTNTLGIELSEDNISNFKLYITYKKENAKVYSVYTNNSAPSLANAADRIYLDTVTIGSDTYDVVIAEKFSNLAYDFKNNVIQSGDMNEDAYLEVTTRLNPDLLIEEYVLMGYTSLVQTVSSTTNQVESLKFSNPTNIAFDVNDQFVVKDTGISNTSRSTGSYYQKVAIISGTASATGTTFCTTLENADNIATNDYIVSKIETDEPNEYRYKLAKIIEKKRILLNNQYVIQFKINTPAYIFADDDALCIWRFKRIEDYANVLKVFSLSGFKMNESHMPASGKIAAYSQLGQLEKILGVLDPANSNLMERLASPDMIDFRYVVDTFNGCISPMNYPKTYLTLLAKKRQQCLAFINAPSMTEFANSTDPRFSNMPTDANPLPDVDTYYISTGGNLDLNPSFTYYLPDEENGSKYCGFFAPYLTLLENGKRINVPPAVYVSNLYVQKHYNGEPFKIVAGVRRGVLSDAKYTGMEFDFQQSDRDYLEPMGINPIIHIPNVGPTIYANKMGYQKSASAFNSLHVRDVLITIESDIKAILKNYIFEYNNEQTRIEIKNRVDAYLAKVQTLEGIYTYEVRMNEVNNPDEVINANMGIIDIYVVPQHGLEKVVANVIVGDSGEAGLSAFTNVFL